MKKIMIISLVLFSTLGASGQLVRPNRPVAVLNGRSGYVTVNEVTAGIGLSGTSTPFSTSYFGFTTMHGYQANETFLLGAGTGLLFYDDGLLIPLYADLRVRLTQSWMSPYLAGAAGLLLNPSDIDSGTRMYLNPAVGLLYSLSRNMALNFSAGIHIQMAPNINRSSFLNTKFGLTYKL